MPLLPNSKQNKEQSIEDFYLGFEKDTSDLITSKRCNNMLSFMKMINDTFKETKIWGLTSHLNLVLQSKDKWDSEWFVTINSIADVEFHIEYLMPDAKKPWDRATVKGITRTLEEAKIYLLIAMRECEGWKDSEELKKLIADNNLN